MLQAIGRLGGQQMKQKCDHLKTKPLDQNDSKIIIDVNQSYDLIKELKESNEHHTKLTKSHKMFQADHRKVIKEMEILQTPLHNTIPWNIRGKQLQGLMFSFHKSTYLYY